MLSKFISVSETHFQNIEAALKNQQASIQGLKTQIGQLSKLISERPKGILPSNTEPNPREHLNAISTQDTEGFIAPEPELHQDNTMNKGREEVNNNDPKKVSMNHKPRVPYPKAMMKDRTEEQFVCYYHEENKDVHEERRLRIEELDKWREHKSRTHDKPKLCKNKPDSSPNQLQVSDTVLLDAVDPHIVTTTPNVEIPLTVLSIFPFGMRISDSTNCTEYTNKVTNKVFKAQVPSTTRPVTRSCLRLCVPTWRETRPCDTVPWEKNPTGVPGTRLDSVPSTRAFA
ncbi:hypothetical protein GOBAR_AA23709 [Gossypium barbadense]|uniref:Uncharacterized protein n=1 Tax=Gossypium barbadense TaxID=3634 RepID=A0A2P5X0T3_GOSBA|nr:hypothetical protein GOBAR_AA23709 [Gossypium barbadense]